jgi:hypothetical protein
VGSYYAQAAYLHPNSVTGISVTTGVEIVIQP